MALDRAKKGRKRAKKLREASLEKSKGGIGRFFKGVKKALKKDTAKQKAASEARLASKQRAHKAKASEQRAKKKVAKKPVSVVKTKGGDYPVYKKESKKAESFRSKFAKSRKAGKKTFTWKGKSYTTKTADDVKKAAPKKVAPKVVAPKVEAPKVEVPKKVAPKVAKPTPSVPEGPFGEEYEAKPGQVSTLMRNKPKEKAGMYGKDRQGRSGNYEDGGKVEANPYGWPSRDARNGGQK